MSTVAVAPGKATRGTSNTNERGSTTDRRRRREYLVKTYRANVDVLVLLDGSLFPMHGADLGAGTAACRCYRCGDLLTVDTVTADRIIPGCKGGTYRRNNIRPACGTCNSETGGPLASRPKKRRARSALSVPRASVSDTPPREIQ